MKEKRVYLRTKDFNYPSISEKRFIGKSIPTIRNFGYTKPIESDISLLIKGAPIKQIHRNSQLYYWDNCLLNRLGKLRFAFINLAVSYKRGIPDRLTNLNERQAANSYLFNYHLEAYLFLYFSSVETINQILNIEYELKLKENAVSTRKVLNKIKDLNPTISEILEAFYIETKPLRDIRNDFTHKFSVNYPDHRSSVEATEKSQSFGSGTGKFIKPSQFISSCKDSLKLLNNVLIQLRSEILQLC